MAIKNIQTAHLVHDLKNPINIIESGARSLIDKPDRYGALNAKQEKVIKRMLRNAVRLRHLTNSMLEVDMAALGIVNHTECIPLNFIRDSLIEVFDLVDPTVSDALEDESDIEKFKNILNAHDVHLEAESASLLTKVTTDETKLSLIITNLLSNAFKYKTKSVFLKLGVDSDSISVSVRDDGPGIPDNYHQQIFDQYFQCDKVEGFPVRGHGLGLAGAQALADALGGTLSLCRGAKGAEFVVTVKLVKAT